MKQTIFALTLMCSVALAQQAAPAPSPAPAQKPLIGSLAARPDWPKAKPEDVHSIEAILAALYNSISGGKGQARDWNRMRSLFTPDAALIPTRIDRATGAADTVVLSLEDYIQRSTPTMTANGFYERTIHNEAQQFGNIVQVWSTYESRHDPADPQPFSRGINSIQLLKSGDRYYIVDVFWDSERPDNPIPAKYLGK
jgi:hypothetical protein